MGHLLALDTAGEQSWTLLILESLNFACILLYNFVETRNILNPTNCFVFLSYNPGPSYSELKPG
jgi:hypothetical protein